MSSDTDTTMWHGIVPIDRQISCVKRELRLREHVYARRVSEGKMTQTDADVELQTMDAVLQTLERVRSVLRPELF
jgi:hypothetical protein